MSTPCTANVDYLLTAEFDNRFGPVVRDQYPSVIPGFEYEMREGHSQNNAVFNLASLMIPNNAEYNTGDEPDTTVFMLYRNRETVKYELFPSKQVDQVICFVNVVYAQEDKSNSRGTNIKAVALGTTMVDFIAFKPFVLECLHKFMKLKNKDDITPMLKSCFKLLNRAELSFVKRLHSNPIRQSLLRSLGDDTRLEKWIDEASFGRFMFKGLLRCHHHDKYTNRITLRRGKISIKLQGYRPKREFADLSKIPLEFDAVTWGSINWNVKYDTKISKFLLNFIPLLHKRDANDSFHFKLVIYSSQYKGSGLSQFAIALSNLMGLTNGTRSFSNKPCLTLPFVDVSIIGPLKEYLALQDRGIFLIMGTTNPIFKSQDGLYDYYYDLDNELISEAANGEGKITPITSNKWDMTAFKRLLTINSISPTSSIETPRIGFLQKIIESIDEKAINFSEIVLAFQKVNVMQLLQLDCRMENINPGDLFDEYITKYRDGVVFQEIFEAESFRILQLLRTINDIMSRLYQLNLPLLDRTDLLCLLDDLFSEIYSFINTDEDHLEKFLAACLRYPFVFPCSQYNLQEDNLVKVNLKQELKNCFKEDKFWLSLVEDPMEQSSILSKFIKDRSLSLICLPLLFNPNIKVKKSPASEPSEAVITPPANVSVRRRKSVSIKQMLNIGKNRESIAETSPLRSNSEASTTSNTSINGRFFRSESSSVPPSKLDHVDVNKKTKNIRSLAYKIICVIQVHFIGKPIIDQSLAPFFKSVLASFQSEQSVKEGTPSSSDSSDTRSSTTTRE
ncbi:hypothetical protein ZYGR_0Z01760 [Zygosaccharomyces rouxii]|uniref:ZYRO0G04356p n=2 Tax=Zygosaccharomyces rouxii TaxID=4956 RepID=C5DZH0_ZYGRC|nr:uncharacterized protein ZYRO0G04356g [Zygosaccharomyces rouxii]KAH9202253.1 docking domain of Afi1 for Arf3 in vesicle trafficking-domain-containing protein [Zygosaccharomyces rouxii]GAV50753.1 hypothetical protein ZYGR_0Z01760 [Zygosaccharomyces rouxii]CAR29254.1 ZYRO0G04356p [Zygosaccharomyces rouxii]